MKVLSLFDGISCGRVALDRAGIEVNAYYSSEIDKHAIKISEDNYPDIIRMGDIEQWESWDIDWSSIDLILAGSPCQGFSNAGEGLNFDDPRSALFFDFMNILNHIEDLNPDVLFMLENVRMKKEWVDVITSYLHVEPVMINSRLVSAQNRERYYWTNIGKIDQPEDREIMLKDVLEKSYGMGIGARVINRRINEDGKRDDYNHSIPLSPYIESRSDDKANCMTTVDKDSRVSFFKIIGRVNIGVNLKDYEHSKAAIDYMNRQVSDGRNHWDFNHHSDSDEDKSVCLVANLFKGVPYNVLIDRRQNGEYVLKVPEATKKGYTEIEDGDCFDATFPKSKTRRDRNMKDKSNYLTAATYNYMVYEHPMCRKFTPVEAERLQTLPDGYTSAASNTQRYRAIGNGWTVDVIAHILGHIK